MQNCCVSFNINYCFFDVHYAVAVVFSYQKVPNLGQTSIIGMVQSAYALAKQTQRERTVVYKGSSYVLIRRVSNKDGLTNY